MVDSIAVGNWERHGCSGVNVVSIEAARGWGWGLAVRGGIEPALKVRGVFTMGETYSIVHGRTAPSTALRHSIQIQRGRAGAGGRCAAPDCCVLGTRPWNDGSSIYSM